ncbi:hypothetical protein ACHWQZ_G014569 [Mnemiopsis leidyi]
MNRLIAVIVLLLFCSSESLLEFKQTNRHTRYWSSSEEFSSQNVSLWKPDILEGYYLLGDTITSGSGPPPRSALLVKPTSSGDLERPVSSQRVWTNKGSKTGVQVSVHRLLAPRGYSCLGMVVERGFLDPAFLDNYRCVKKLFLTRGDVRTVWDDESTSLYNRGHLDVIEAVDDRSGGLSFQHFLVDRYRRHTFPVWVISSEFIMSSVSEESAVLQKGLSVKEADPGMLIWKEENSRVAIYSAEILFKESSQLYRAGSYLDSHESPEPSFLLSGKIGAEIDFPETYIQLYGDPSSLPLFLWQPVCSTSYFALGLYATNRPTLPVNETVCVHESFTKTGVWSFAKTDKKLEHTLWKVSGGEMSLGSFTYTPSIYQRPEITPTILDMDKVNSAQQTPEGRVSYKLTSIKLEEPSRTFSKRYKTTAFLSSSRSLQTTVTAMWSVDTNIRSDVSPIKIVTDQMSGALSEYQDVIVASAKKSVVLGRYTTFLHTFTTIEEPPEPDLITQLWVDIKFSATLSTEPGTPVSGRRVSGMLNLIVVWE